MATEFSSEPKNLYVSGTFGNTFDKTHQHLWHSLMVKKIQCWDDRVVVTPVSCLPDIKTIKTKWIFDLKLNRDVEIIRRAQSIIKEFIQRLGEHYFALFAAVVRYNSVRMLFAIIAAWGLNFWLVDFVGAYLNVKLQGKNYLKIPEGFLNHYTIPDVERSLHSPTFPSGLQSDSDQTLGLHLDSDQTSPPAKDLQICSPSPSPVHWSLSGV
jgi:hypothetical protein